MDDTQNIVSSKAIAATQMLITVVYTVGYFMVLSDFIHGKVNVPPEWKDQLSTLIGVLTAGQLLILNYWFARHRQ